MVNSARLLMWGVLISLSGYIKSKAEQSTVYHIKPTEDTQCSQKEDCHTLNNLVNLVQPNGQWNLSGNTVLKFLPGLHSLSHILTITGNHSLTLTGPENGCANIKSIPSVSIKCTTGLENGFSTESLSMFSLKCLQIHDCAMHITITTENVEMIGVYSHRLFFEANGNSQQSLLFANMQSISSVFMLTSCPNAIVQNSQFYSQKQEKDVRISQNIQPPYPQNSLKSFSTIRYIHIYDTTLTIESSNFYGASNTAIYSHQSSLHMKGTIIFEGNSGIKGGAIALHSSIIQFDGAMVLFSNNNATSVGGAIYASNDILDSYLLRVHIDLGSYTMSTLCSVVCYPSINMSVRFINNKAVDGGSAVYGITLDTKTCNSYYCNLPGYTDIASKLFTFEPEEPAVVSSAPLRVCACQNNLPNCTIQNPHYYNGSVFPGQNFNISIAVVGLVYGTVKSTVNAQLLEPLNTSTLGTDFEQSQTVFGCTDVQYKVHSLRHEETLILTTLKDSRQLGNQPQNGTAHFGTAIKRFTTVLPQTIINSALYIKIRIQECPLGFVVSTTRPVHCKCEPVLEQHGLSQEDCIVHNQTIRRMGTIWLSYVHENTTSGVIGHDHCPFGYCRPEVTFVDLRDPDAQCTQERSGTLCGGCKKGFSLSLGSSRCMKCTNNYISLLVLFIAAGVLLVFVIKVLNLTVSVGTINGLIFYVNVVAANKAIFLSSGHNIPKALGFFIAWVNLDLGIETCFFNGLDGYWKTWLQFVFPLYIWSIAGIIIIASQYSTRVTKIIGNNSVPVLATLLLLSYGKLLRTIIAIFSVSNIVYPDNATHLVWAFDGNVQYFGPRHIPLFIAGVLVLVILWLPYTAILLSGHTIRRCSSHNRLRWMLKLQLFFDAYHGPFKDKHVHWVGVLLVVRIILFTTFAAFFATETSVNLLAISIATVILLMYTHTFGSPYKKRWVAFLESSFILNLSILSSGTLYIEMTRGNGRDWLAGASIGVALFQYLGIIIYHSCAFTFNRMIKRIKNWMTTRLIGNRNFLRMQEIDDNTVDHLDNEYRDTESSPTVDTRPTIVTETVVDHPGVEEPMSKLLGHYEDRHITGTTYCSQ